jgi:hypothetical protein
MVLAELGDDLVLLVKERGERKAVKNQFLTESAGFGIWSGDETTGEPSRRR